MIQFFKDVERPSFEQCPNTLMFFPGDNMDTAYILWNKPTVVDNKDSGLEHQNKIIAFLAFINLCLNA